MDFSIEFYVSRSGAVPVQEFLEELRRRDPDDHAAVLRGLVKLRDRQYHRAPLSKPIGEGLFELRHVGKLNTRVMWFFMRGTPDHRRSWHSEQKPGDPGTRPRNRADADARLAGKI